MKYRTVSPEEAKDLISKRGRASSGYPEIRDMLNGAEVDGNPVVIELEEGEKKETIKNQMNRVASDMGKYLYFEDTGKDRIVFRLVGSPDMVRRFPSRRQADTAGTGRRKKA